MLGFWAVPLYTSNGGQLTGWNLSVEHSALWLVPVFLLVHLWASWTGRPWVRFGAIAGLVLIGDVAVTLVDGERVMLHSGAWFVLIVLIFAFAAALEDRLIEFLPGEIRQAVPFIAVTLSIVALAPVYFSFEAHERSRNPIYRAFAAMPETPPAPAPRAAAPAPPAPAVSPTPTEPEPAVTEPVPEAPAREPDLVLANAKTCTNALSGGGAWTRQVADSAPVTLDWSPSTSRVSVVTANGEFYASVDEGESWTDLDCKPLFRFLSVRFNTAEVGWAVGALGASVFGPPAIAQTRDGGATWVVRQIEQQRASELGHLKDLKFWDESHGIVIADYGVLRTEDAGQSWHDSGPANFTGTTNAVTFGAGPSVWIYESARERSTIHRSLDGGVSWQAISGFVAGSQQSVRRLDGSTEPFPPLRDLAFYVPDFGLVLDDDERLYATRDGGRTWFETLPVNTGSPGPRTLRAYGAKSAVVLQQGPEGGVYVTDDAAQTWTMAATAARQSSSCRAHLFGEDASWRIGCAGSLERTGDGGSVWHRVGPFGVNRLRAVQFADATTGWALGSDAILTTSDGGENWHRFNLPAGEHPIAGTLIRADAGWTLTRAGRIMRFRGDSAPWSIQRLGGANEIWYDIQMLDAQRGWVVGAGGRVLLTRNGGLQWQPRSTLFDETLRALWFVDPQFGWAVGEHGIVLHSQDGGLSWRDQPLGTGSTFTAVHFRDRANGWIAGESERLFSTDDGGRTWRATPAPTAPPFYAIRFFDDRHGWLVAKDGWYRTDDGAATWKRVGMPEGGVFTTSGPKRAWFENAGLAWAVEGSGVWRYRAAARDPAP